MKEVLGYIVIPELMLAIHLQDFFGGEGITEKRVSNFFFFQETPLALVQFIGLPCSSAQLYFPSTFS